MYKQLTTLFLSFFCMAGLTSLAVADVTIEQNLKVDAGGGLSMAAMSGTTVTSIVADRSRTDNDLKFKSKIMQTFGGGLGKNTSIVRLDEERVLTVNYEKKRYTETTFAEMRTKAEQALQQMEEMREPEDEQQTASTELPVTEQNCEWADSTLEIMQSGERQKIAGLKAERSIFKATQTCRDPETGKSCDLTWSLELWLAAKAPGADEVQAFWRRYAEKLGLEEMVGQAGTPSMTMLLSQYGQGWEEIEEQSGKLQGYPVKTIMQLEIGGEECTTPEGQPLSYENVFGDAMADAASDAAAEGVGEAVGGSVGGAVAKSLFGAFGKKKKAKPVATAEPVAGTVRLFRFESETTKIATKSVSDDRFDIPAGFTLAD